MQRRIGALTFAGAMALGALTSGAVLGQSPANGGQPWRVGGGFALTGDESILDVPANSGALLAVKEINAAGGVLGQPIDFKVHDSQYDFGVTAEIAKTAVEEDKVQAFIGYTDTDSVIASAQIFQDANIPYITVGATSPKIPSQITGDSVFLAAFGDNVQAAAGAEYAMEHFGKTAYLLSDNGIEYTRLLGQYFKAAFEAAGGTIVLEDVYEDKATEFSPQIAKVSALPAQPDFYYIAAMPYNVGPVVKGFRDAGLTKPIMGGDGYDDPTLVKVAGAAAENVFFSTHALMNPDIGTPEIQKFIAAYTAEYGHAPENAFAGLGYDSVYLLADAITRAGGMDSEALKTAIETTTGFPGITGSITYTPDAHIPQKGVTIIAVKDGQFTLGAELVPTSVPAP
jgi:branched-chain amino acid transport system substrate-binding protein